MSGESLKLFALERSAEFGSKVAEAAGMTLARHEEREFEDGEHKARPLESVRNADVYVIHSLYGEEAHSVNDKLVRLLFFLGAVRDAGAARVTAITPLLCYSRKDRQTKTRDPVSTRYVACLLESVGVDRVVTLDVHNLAAFQNAFRCRTEHLEARKPFVEQIASGIGEDAVVVVSPDAGGVKRAERFRESLQSRLGRPVGSAFMEKKRSSGVVSGEAVVGDVSGQIAIIVDDLIASGGTIARTVDACTRRGATRCLAVATHGLFAEAAEEHLAIEALERVLITDSVPPFRLRSPEIRAKVEIISIAPLLADAIQRFHRG